MKPTDPIKINGIELLTPKEITALSGKSLLWVRTCLRNGRLKSLFVHGRYYITHEQYKEWEKSMTNRGRPKKGSE